jgi:hypothetical protein
VVLLEVQRGAQGQTSWSGALRIPAELVGAELRLVLTEHELFAGDELGELNERTVYLDIIGL